jgi:glycosyltransferase involved in cell wall biosynthesis
MAPPIRVLMITTAWPTPGQPRTTHFIKRQADYLRAAGVDVDVFHFHSAKNPWNYAAAWLRVRPRLRSGRYDLVHAQFGQSGLLALPKRLPIVVTLRGSDILGIVGRNGRYRWVGRIGQTMSRLVARHADAVVAVSGHMTAYLPRNVDATILPSGLDFELFQPYDRDESRKRLGLAPDNRLVLFVGNPAQARKRYDLARGAVELLNATMPAELVVAWGVEHDDVPRYMSACDALVFTSMQEGSPNVVKEALACDLPVVSVPIGDVPLRLRGIDGCEVCADDRAETIAGSLGRVLARGKRIAGRAAVQNLDERFITSQLIDVYRRVLRPSAQPLAAATHHEPEAANALR